jgi:arylsulfatase
VPDEWLRRYNHRYDEGWDVIRKERLARMQELGIVEKGVNTADRMFYLPRASALAVGARKMQGRHMEIYASMVEYMDDQIGRVFNYLKEIGEYDNTVVIFFSDNGAEGANLMKMFSGQPGTAGYMHAVNNFAEAGHNSIGRKGTFAEYGPAWAQVGMTPFRLYKGFLAEGGTRSPLIISGPGVQGHYSDRAGTCRY